MTTLTRAENLQAMLQGRRAAWVPCSINFAQWYHHHRAKGTLPADLQATTGYIPAMKVLGMDIFSRNLDGGARVDHEGVTFAHQTEEASQGPRHITVVDTPHGRLRSIREEQTWQSTSYSVEDLVKDWDRDGKAYLWLLERQRFRWDREAFARTLADVGDDGLVMVPVGCSPLKNLHNNLGLDHACLFVLDHPNAAKTVCDLYWQRLWPVLKEIAGDPRVHAACLMDNVDAPFYPPALCYQYWLPYVRQAADLFQSRHKRLFVHACGKLRQLKPVFRESGVHGLEGMAHAPLGDFSPRDALDLPEHFIYNGGFTAQEQVIRSDADLEAFYEEFFQQVGDFPRFIFAAACQTTIDTPWPRIRKVVEICRRYGGSPA